MATPNKGFEGIIVYTIHKDGCLNGLYYATGNPQGPTYNEIARKLPTKTTEENEENGANKQNKQIQDLIVGDYVCCWIDGDNNVQKGKLKIQPRNTVNPSAGTFDVTWYEGGRVSFKGTGFLLDNNIFTVHYTT